MIPRKIFFPLISFLQKLMKRYSEVLLYFFFILEEENTSIFFMGDLLFRKLDQISLAVWGISFLLSFPRCEQTYLALLCGRSSHRERERTGGNVL